MSARLLLAASLVLSGCAGSVMKARGPVSLAVTVDDLPSGAAIVPPGASLPQVADPFISAFRKRGMTGVYGFVVGRKMEDQQKAAGLEAWVKAGLPIGNHTFSHEGLNKLSLEDFIKDIEADEPFLEKYAADPKIWKVFRFPYLEEGDSFPKRDGLRKYLDGRGYRIAEVTIDFQDWLWNEPYQRCVKKNDQAGILELKRAYLEEAAATVDMAVEIAEKVSPAPVPHILLLHIGGFTGLVIEDLLALLEQKNVRFIPLKGAMKDPLYSKDTRYADSAGVTFLLQMAGVSDRMIARARYQRRAALLNAVCADTKPR